MLYIPFTLSIVALLEHCFQCLNCWSKTFRPPAWLLKAVISWRNDQKSLESLWFCWRQGSAFWFPCGLRFSGPETAPPLPYTCFPGSFGFNCQERWPNLIDWEPTWRWRDLGREALEGASELLVRGLRPITYYLCDLQKVTKNRWQQKNFQSLDYLKCWLFTLSLVLIQVLPVSTSYRGVLLGCTVFGVFLSCLLFCIQWYPVCF